MGNQFVQLGSAGTAATPAPKLPKMFRGVTRLATFDIVTIIITIVRVVIVITFKIIIRDVHLYNLWSCHQVQYNILKYLNCEPRKSH